MRCCGTPACVRQSAQSATTELRLQSFQVDCQQASSTMPAIISRADASAAWAEIDVPAGLGMSVSETVKWRQNQTFVEVFVALPDPARGAADVKVHIGAERLIVAVAGAPVLDGRTFAPVKAEASTWVVADGVLELSLLMRYRALVPDGTLVNSFGVVV